MVINYINRILPGGEGEAPTVWNSAVDASGQDVAARPRALRIGPTDDATPRVAEERPGPSGLDVALRDLTEDPSELLGWTPEDLLSVLARDVAA
jgi:hypothetical protein